MLIRASSGLLTFAIAIGPVFYFSVRGALGVVVTIMLLVAMLVLWLQHPIERVRASESRMFVIAMSAPLTAVLMSQAWHGEFLARELDAPLRFSLASILFLALLRLPSDPRRWLGFGFAAASGAALLVVLLNPAVAENDYWLNRIHFGNAALALGLMSLMSIDWAARDSAVARAVKLTGFAAGIGASILSLSRGGWFAFLLLSAVALVCQRVNLRWRLAAGLGVAFVCLLMYVLSPQVQQRVNLVESDLVSYAEGNRDTSIGIRLQHWTAALYLLREKPIFGTGDRQRLGSDLSRLSSEGLLTPMAASFSELHSQPLAFAVNFGLLGLASLFLMHLLPVAILLRLTKLPDCRCRRSAWMAICWSLLFLGFGLTQEVFSLKSTSALYAFWMAAMTAVAIRAKPPVDPAKVART